ncbi:MAG: NUDIX hydrolase [Deltaproteobacteria bacterium]|nr:MAG: NUDIX hydrolase [Deltaproteobacteria bacterium]
MTYCYPYPLPAVAVDVAVFSVDPDDLSLVILVIRRGRPPAAGAHALPGGFVEVGEGYRPGAPQGEDLPDAASRELREETGLDVEACGGASFQVGAFGTPGRDPRGRVVSALYAALVPTTARRGVRASDDAADAAFVPVARAASDGFDWAFDHRELLDSARCALARQVLLDARILRPWIGSGLREHLAVLYPQLVRPLGGAPSFERWLARQVEDGHVQRTATGHRLAPGRPIGGVVPNP